MPDVLIFHYRGVPLKGKNQNATFVHEILDEVEDPRKIYSATQGRKLVDTFF